METEINDMQFGWFTLSERFLRENLNVVADLFRVMRFIPIHIHHSFFDDIIYEGISPLFAEVQEDAAIPGYDVSFDLVHHGEGARPVVENLTVAPVETVDPKETAAHEPALSITVLYVDP